MYTVDHFRERYSRSVDSSLLSLLDVDPARLTPEARVALAEEIERRALRPVPIASEPRPALLDPAPAPSYPKVKLDNRLAAWIFDAIIGTCHPYRRKWRSERTHHPLKAVAVAGGWTDFDTMMRCYDIPEDSDVLAVTSETRKRREASAPSVNASSGR